MRENTMQRGTEVPRCIFTGIMNMNCTPKVLFRRAEQMVERGLSTYIFKGAIQGPTTAPAINKKRTRFHTTLEKNPFLLCNPCRFKGDVT